MAPTANRPLVGNKLIGTEHVYHDVPYKAFTGAPYDPSLVVANGMQVVVHAVFRDWNGIEGLDMLYVRCPDTGKFTHVTPADLNLLGV